MADRETILVIDDEPLVRDLVRDVLEGRGYFVIEARGVQEGLAAADAYAGRIALALTDFMLPGMNGGALAEKLLQIQSDLRVLVTSGFNGDSLDLPSGDPERLDFLQKPFTINALVTKIEGMLAAQPQAAAT